MVLISKIFYAVAPICYAHLAASQVAQFMKFEDMSETSSRRSDSNASLVPQLPKLDRRVCNSMFFVWVRVNEIM